MKITTIRVYRAEMPLQHPYRLSGGRLYFDKLDSTLVAIDTDSGMTGWGEGCPWGSTYLPAFASGIRAGIEELAPQLLDSDPRRLDVVNRTMDLALPGHGYVKSAIDVACWDLLDQYAGLPVCDLLGGNTGEDIRLHSSIPTGTPDEMLASIERARDKGYGVHSCKVGADVALDIERIRVIGATLPATQSVTFDANRAWLPDEAIRVMNGVRDVMTYFEQPCETYEENLAVRRATVQPIALDESIQTFADLARAHSDHACEAIGLKINRVGGLSKAKRLRDYCLATGLRMNIEETGGSVIADTGAVHLAQATPASHRRGTWLCHDMLTVDLAEGGARNAGGITRAPDLPGLGVTPDESLLGDPVAVYR